MITYNSHPWIMFSLNDLVIIWRMGEEGGGSFESGRPRSRDWKNFGRRWMNWIIFIDVICVASLINFDIIMVSSL